MQKYRFPILYPKILEEKPLVYSVYLILLRLRTVESQQLSVHWAFLTWIYSPM